MAGIVEGRFSGLRKEVETAREGVLLRGRHQVVVLDFTCQGGTQPVAVKFFGRQLGWKDRYDLRRGSKAARSFQAACFLEEHGVSTPPPLGYLDPIRKAIDLPEKSQTAQEKSLEKVDPKT